jgi:hypothetical protein
MTDSTIESNPFVDTALTNVMNKLYTAFEIYSRMFMGKLLTAATDLNDVQQHEDALDEVEHALDDLNAELVTERVGVGGALHDVIRDAQTWHVLRKRARRDQQMNAERDLIQARTEMYDSLSAFYVNCHVDQQPG